MEKLEKLEELSGAALVTHYRYSTRDECIVEATESIKCIS
jgi:hypothetical protein